MKKGKRKITDVRATWCWECPKCGLWIATDIEVCPDCDTIKTARLGS